MSDVAPSEALLASLCPLLQPELVTICLTRLPVKSILRFRSVSKAFCSFIDTQHFIENHLKHSIETNTNNNIIVCGNGKLFTVPFDSHSPKAEPLDNPWYSALYEPKTTTVLGSCNGVVCLCDVSPDTGTVINLGLLNPLTKMVKTNIPGLPYTPGFGSPWSSSSASFSPRKYAIGFGYDCVDRNFKVVSFIQTLGFPTVRVYNLREDAWGPPMDFPYYLCYRWSSSVFVNHCLHWIVSMKPIVKDNERMIVSFNISTMEHSFLPQPDYSHDNYELGLSILNGCVSVACCHESGTDIWLMKNYNDRSWIKLAEMRSNGFRPLAYFEPLDKVFMEVKSRKFVWFDLIQNKAKSFGITGLPNSFVACAYVGGLAQVESEKDAIEKKKLVEMLDKKRKMRQRRR